jgi:uncharacterized protein (TIGR03067 family)
MTRYRWPALLVALAFAGWLAAADDDKDDGKKFQGTWTVVSVESEGKPNDKLKSVVFTFTGEKLRVKVGDDTKEGTVKLDAAKKPKEITITPSDGEKPLLGIYEFDKDNLKLCVSEAGATDRPKAFASKEGERMVYFVLKPEKKE